MKHRAIDVLRDSLNVLMLASGGLLIAAGGLWLFALPARVAARQMQGSTLTAFALLAVVIIGAIAVVFGWDAFAYLYGLRRPMIVTGPRGDRWRLVSRVAASPAQIIRNCFVSYGSLLYLFVTLYLWLSYSDPAAFGSSPLSITDAVYFTLSTAATVGYGDICACSPIARGVVSVQIVVSFVAAVFVFSVAAGLAVRPSIDRDCHDQANVHDRRSRRM